MDNLTHTLLGIALARAGGKRLGPYATGILAMAANAPDVDALSRLNSTAAYLQWHRGITHSLVAAPVLAGVVVGLVVLGRKLARSTRPFPAGRAFLVALGGIVFAHILMDWTTSYGTRLLLPFSDRWLAWGAIPILDLWLLLALAAGLTLPSLFRLISEEIGASSTSGPGGALFALAFLLVWVGFRGVCHARATAVLDSYSYSGREPRRVDAFAHLANPFRWHGVVETAGTWEVAEVDLLEEFDPMRTRTYYMPEPSPALDAARGTRTARIFLDFARYPYSYVEQTDSGYEVVMRDLRFDNNITGRSGFVVQVRLTRELAVTGEEFHFRPSRPVR